MPGKRGSRSSKRSQPRRRRQPQSRGVPPLLPPSRVVPLVYCDRKFISESGTASGANYTWSLNNIYDPDKTGTGLQPINFDQICALYTQFRVVRVEYEVKMCCSTAYTPGTVLPTSTVGVVPTWNDALPTSPVSWFGLARSRNALLNPLGGSNVKTFAGSVTPWEVLSIPKRQYMDDTDYICTTTGGPARSIYLNCFVVGNGAASGIMLSVSFTYHVQCMIPVLNTFS